MSDIQSPSSKGMTWCPDCFEGKVYSTCPNCQGAGEYPYHPKRGDEYPAKCSDCGGSGELVSDSCDTCEGSQFITTALLKLMDARKYTGGEQSFMEVDENTYRQTNEGITMYALAAYFNLRGSFRDPSTVVEAGMFPMRAEWDGVIHHLPDIHGVKISSSSKTLILTGLSWGYGGEGPNGLATILHDLGKFQDHKEALNWVGALNKDDIGWVIQ